MKAKETAVKFYKEKVMFVIYATLTTLTMLSCVLCFAS